MSTPKHDRASEPAAAPPAPELSAFESLYRLHFRFVWRALRRLGVPERDLPDAVQEVFVVVHQKIDQFSPTSRVTTWLYAIALRVASDRRRRASARHEVLGAQLEAAHGESKDAGEIGERRALLEQALGALSLEQRAVFTLFELEGLTGDEIRELLDVPLATVHSRLRLARENFRRAIARARAKEAFDLVRLGEERS